MPQKLEGDMRGQIAEFLPKALETALDSYRIFSDQVVKKKDEENTEPLKPTEFKSHHDACKMALSHLQLLLKVADDLKAGEEGGIDNEHMQTLLESARQELDR